MVVVGTGKTTVLARVINWHLERSSQFLEHRFARHEVMVKDIDTFGHCREINLNTFLTRADMENFINLEVRGREKHSRLLKGEHPDLENRLIKVLEMKAGGMFRWVQLQLSLFLANNKLNHPKDVEKKLALLEAGSVAGVEELNQAYADVFKRNTPQGDIEKGHAVKLYKILLCRKDGLTAAALAEALAFDENEAEHWMYDDIWEMADIDKKVMDSTVTGAYVLGLCRDFVTEFDDDSLDFAHISVKDYLQGEGTGSLPEDQFSTAHCTQQMAKLCLRYFITRNEEPPIAPAGWRSPTHNFMFYAWERLGEHCSELSKELRVESGITADLVNWMQVAKGRNPFTNFLKLGRSHMASLLNHVLQSDSNSAIFAACAWNLVEVVESLIVTYPGYINLRNVQDSTPLYLACWLGRAQVVELLLDLDLADVEGIGTSGSALDCSALHGASDPAIAQLLLTKYPELVHSVDSLGRTPLFETQHSWEWAALLVKVYLENGANVDATDNDGETALHVNLSNPEATRVLAEKAKADARDKQGRTPLHIAAENALLPAVQILTRRTTVDLADDGGMTALLHAAANDMDEDGYIETIEHLLGFGASISSTNSEGQGVVHLAENSRVVEYFLRSDAHARNPRDQLDAKDKDGDTPILLAARFTMVAKMMTLIEAGADVKEKNNAGQNSLHLIMGDAKVNFPSDASP
ncbi:putative Serine/threonine-protein phosphatase 6 regulatory ankyrin repeat subunit B [Glarea lozoyensis 74030]|uniref:Putative Serine/threonine-protein phosphatase 6 regulatory ankyrin repeat subunit B n=1 Tax=Glarea lozoyensis (strain ATCC 74030 / MF5533) TaxID=1104152 RepID=H0EKD2_GLAL7|nr:putative Serine/threonine-protein phosphatase 6 regulatory ankyrin repeat subunit B [Glarea lozoyensis 74030]